MISYASQTGTLRNLAALKAAGWRLLYSTAYDRPPRPEFRYALDNGAWTYFQKKKTFDSAAFARGLLKYGAAADWVAIPDIVMGGAASLRFSLFWIDEVLAVAKLALLPVQNGMVDVDVERYLGDRVGLFIGGDAQWKEATVEDWCALGRRRGCHVHVARVNTVRRIKICAVAGAHSIDGTSASRFSKTVPKLNNARNQLPLKGLFR